MCVRPVGSNYRSVARKHQALVDIKAFSLLQQRIDFRFREADAMSASQMSPCVAEANVADVRA
jgi:hypothetical protein